LFVANECVDEVTIPIWVIIYNQCSPERSANQIAAFTSN